jgi:hypothetical protein
MATRIWTSRQFRDRADEVRARAVEMKDREARATMMRIAELYDHLANRLSRQESGEHHAPPASDQTKDLILVNSRRLFRPARSEFRQSC